MLAGGAGAMNRAPTTTLSSSGERPLAIVGNLNVDQWIGPVHRFPAWDEEVLVESARIELAGTAGYLLQACRGLGMDAFVVSTIGDDLFGGIVRDELRTLGFDDAGVDVLPGYETSLGMIFVGPSGERGILTVLGAHTAMEVAVAERHDERIAGCAEVFLCGNYLLPKLGPVAVLPYARRLRARGQAVVFDPSWDPAGWSEVTRRDTLALLEEVDVYLPNEEELKALTSASDLDAALELVSGRAGEVVVKRGASGAVYVSGETRVECGGFPVTAVNTIGAGDVFDIGYLYARRQQCSPEERLRFACALAAMVVVQPGARRYPNAGEVERFIEEHHADRGDH